MTLHNVQGEMNLNTNQSRIMYTTCVCTSHINLTKAMFLMKINYNFAWWHNCLEVMCATYFIIGPHQSLVSEYGATRYGVINKALKTQLLIHNIVVPPEEVMTP